MDPTPLSGLRFLDWKGWEARGFGRPFAFWVSKILQSFGVSLLPSPRPALLGPMQQPWLGARARGWGGAGEGDQPVGAEGLEPVAP